MEPPVRNVRKAFSNGPVRPSASWANWAWLLCLSVPLVDPAGDRCLRSAISTPVPLITYWVVVDEEV
eukprot:10764848-Ditylum_brightwellii.AAC.1